MLRLSLLFSALCLAAPLSAQETETRRVIELGPSYTAPVSGSAAQSAQTLHTDSPHGFLTGLGFSERSDAPCWTGATFRDRSLGNHRRYPLQNLNTDPDWVGTDARWETTPCAGSNNDLEWLKTQMSGEVTAIRALRIGMNKNETKLKAVEIRGVTLDQDGAGEVRNEAGLDDDFQRTNFREPWQSWSACNAGDVAVGVRVYMDTRGGYSGEARTTGLALVCAPVVEIRSGLFRTDTDEEVSISTVLDQPTGRDNPEPSKGR